MASSLTPPVGPAEHLRRKLAADRDLQREIDMALASLVDGPQADAASDVASILAAVLAPGWGEHTEFQEEALFPLLVAGAEATLATRDLLNRLSREHAEIAERQRAIAAILGEAAAGRWAAFGRGRALFTDLMVLRRGHLEAELALDLLVPATLAPADRLRLEHWAQSRLAWPFPVDVLLEGWKRGVSTPPVRRSRS